LLFIGEIGFHFLSDGGYPKVKYLICPFKWPEVGIDRQKWTSHLESIRKNIERTFGSIKQRFGCLVNPITLQDAHHLEQMFNGCCVLHNIILDYNGAYNWRKRVVVGLLLPAEVIDDVPVIEKDFSYTRNAHRNDDEWIIIQDMPTPSHDLRTKARHFVNDDASKIEMMVRLNTLQNHFVFVVASKQIGKLKRMCDIEPGSLKYDYIHPSTLDNTNM
jgi:hypothetical protein